jgi:hypothetical protein
MVDLRPCDGVRFDPNSGHWATSVVRFVPIADIDDGLFDHLVGTRDQRLHVESKRLGSLEIDHQLVLGRRLTGRSAGFSPLRIRST